MLKHFERTLQFSTLGADLEGVGREKGGVEGDAAVWYGPIANSEAPSPSTHQPDHAERGGARLSGSMRMRSGVERTEMSVVNVAALGGTPRDCM